MIEERFLLARERIGEIETENILQEALQGYFCDVAKFLGCVCENYDFIRQGGLASASLQELKRRNESLYEDILPEHYGKSYANPDYCCACLGKEHGQILCFLYAELRSLIPFSYEDRLEDMVIRLELFLEIYGSYSCESQENGGLPGPEAVRDILYWFVYDYARFASGEKIRNMLVPGADPAGKLLLEADLSSPRYLYFFGEYITDNQLKTWEHLNGLPLELIQKMADTYTEGYRIGFQVGNKDITKKKTVNLRYCLGFEPMIRKAAANFEKMGLLFTVYRGASSILMGRSVNRIGYYGEIPNRQYDFDHKDDLALVLDRRLVHTQLEALKAAYETCQEQARVFGGPAVVEVFGQTPEALQEKKTALRLSDAQQKLMVEYKAAAGQIQNSYIPGEERSFTIIAFPIPEIGPEYPRIFDEVIRINTLDYKSYQRIQQKIIDTLDQGTCVLIKGRGRNRTNMKVMLSVLLKPDKQTNFENCVADVNIPVGEVFTSPLLKGTEGLLHVTRVYLNELEYKDLVLSFKDGMVTEYSCENYADLKENQKYIKDNVLFHHDSLPLGEFAIGTNTAAYVMARKYGIEDKLPILIAEKTGPHFALGDTCYSHAEDVAVYNPDGKEIVARENEYSLRRKEGASDAYFNCHTDITIPYDELGEVSVVTKEGEKIPIILEGKFVLPGCGELNRPLEEQSANGV